MKTRFEVISRTVTRGRVDERHSLQLLHCPLPSKPEPWWQHPAGLNLTVAAEFEAEPGDFFSLTMEREEG